MIYTPQTIERRAWQTRVKRHRFPERERLPYY